MSYVHLTGYFCWRCGDAADHAVPVAPHYENPLRLVRFCSHSCRADYLQLAAL
jgi:hypothetical protein